MITVTTQKELDSALEAGEDIIEIDSPNTVWLNIESYGASNILVRFSSRVRVHGSYHVEALESSHVEAHESARVLAFDSSNVLAFDSTYVEARDESRVAAWDGSNIMAYGSSNIAAFDGAHVKARGLAHVEARDSSYVDASKYVSVHLRSKRATVTGDGVVTDATDVHTDLVSDFIEFYGVKVVEGEAILYKVVDSELCAGHTYTRTKYPIGETVTATDWSPTQTCGFGLHFGYRPIAVRNYFSGRGEPRFLEVAVKVDGMVALGDKVKAESCRVLREVDIHGSGVALVTKKG